MSRHDAVSPPSATWDPVQYGAFADHRGRPFAELLARVPVTDPEFVADLGCGSGELTARLAARWPDALIEGIDASPEMIEAAQAHAVPGRLSFTLGDVTGWRPQRSPDLIVSNAVLHWIPEHTDLLQRWIDALPPGGCLAFQVPGNHDAPSHVLLRDLCRTRRWRDRLDGVLPPDRPILDPAGYLDLLSRHGCAVDAWETTYVQILQGDDPVLEWVKGTALRPILTVLDEGEARAFLDAYGALLREAYPPEPYGTAFPFRRVFVVATRRPSAPGFETREPGQPVTR